MAEKLNSGIDIAASPLISPKGATQNSVPVMLCAPSSSASLDCELTSVQQESRFGVLKNRPLPSTVAVTLLGTSTPESPDFRPGRAMMMAKRSPEISPAKRILTPSPLGRRMFSQSMSSADHLISASMLPNSEAVANPVSPQVRAGGGNAASTSTSLGAPQAPRGPSNSSHSSGDFCAETDFFLAGCNGIAFQWSELGLILLKAAKKRGKNDATGWSYHASSLEWHAAAHYGVINERQRTIPTA